MNFMRFLDIFMNFMRFFVIYMDAFMGASTDTNSLTDNCLVSRGGRIFAEDFKLVPLF